MRIQTGADDYFIDTLEVPHLSIRNHHLSACLLCLSTWLIYLSTFTMLDTTYHARCSCCLVL